MVLPRMKLAYFIKRHRRRGRTYATQTATSDSQVDETGWTS